MSFWDSIFNGQTLAEDFSGINIKTEYGKLAENERNIETNKQASIDKANLIIAEGKADALRKGFTFEQGILGSTERAGSPGVPQNSGGNVADIIKWYSENSPATFQEKGKAGESVLVINTPGGKSDTVTTPEGTSVRQSGGDTTQNKTLGSSFDWVPILLIAGLVLIVITVIKKG